MAGRFGGRGSDRSALRKGKEEKDKIDLPNWNGGFRLNDAPALLPTHRPNRNCSSYLGSANPGWCRQGEFKEPWHRYGTIVDASSASHWIRKASNAEAKGKYQDAANILMEGKSKGAQPEADLDRGLEDIHQRWQAVKDYEEKEAAEKVERRIQRFSQFSGSRTVTPRFRTTIPIPLALTQSNPSSLNSRPGRKTPTPITAMLPGKKRSSVRFKSEVQVIEPADELQMLPEGPFPAQIVQALAQPTTVAVESVAEPRVQGCQPAHPSAPEAHYSPMQTSPAPAIDATGIQRPQLQGVRLSFQSVLDSERPSSRDGSKVQGGGVCRQGDEQIAGDDTGPVIPDTKDVLARMLAQVFCATIHKMTTGVPAGDEAQCPSQWQGSQLAPTVEVQLNRPASTARQHLTGAQVTLGALVSGMEPYDGQFTRFPNRFRADGCGNPLGAPFSCLGPMQTVNKGGSKAPDARLRMANEGGPVVAPSISNSNSYSIAATAESLLQCPLWRAGDPNVHTGHPQPLEPPQGSMQTHHPVNMPAASLSKQREKGMAAHGLRTLSTRQLLVNSSRGQPTKLQPRPPWRHSTQGQASARTYADAGVRGDVASWSAKGRSQQGKAGSQQRGKIHHGSHLHGTTARARRVRNGRVGSVSETAALLVQESREGQRSSRQHGPSCLAGHSGFHPPQQAALNSGGARELGDRRRTAKVPRCAGIPGRT